MLTHEIEMQWYNRYILSMVWYYCRLKLGLLNAVAWLFNIIIIRLIMVTRAPLSFVVGSSNHWNMKLFLSSCRSLLNKKSYFTVAFHSISFCETVSHSLKWKEKKKNGMENWFMYHPPSFLTNETFSDTFLWWSHGSFVT